MPDPEAEAKALENARAQMAALERQYEELEAFSKFSSDMDAITAMTLDKGRKNNQLLIQPQYSPMPVGEQVAILYCGTNALMRDLPLDRVREFQDRFLDRMRGSYGKVLDELAAGKLTDEICRTLEKLAAEVIAGMIK